MMTEEELKANIAELECTLKDAVNREDNDLFILALRTRISEAEYILENETKT